MKLFETITDDNFELFAAHYYDNAQCTDPAEFYDDLNRFRYLKRLLRRYYVQDDLQDRLILNHIIVLSNVFGIEPAKKMFLYKIEKEHWPTLKTFLVFLHYLREDEMIDIPLDQTVIDKLREI